MNFLLKAFPIEMLISFLIQFLISTIKNPTSDKARKVRSIVQTLNNVTQEFLDRTDPGAGASTRVV
jgi:hypothetical protein